MGLSGAREGDGGTVRPARREAQRTALLKRRRFCQKRMLPRGAGSILFMCSLSLSRAVSLSGTGSRPGWNRSRRASWRCGRCRSRGRPSGACRTPARGRVLVHHVGLLVAAGALFRLLFEALVLGDRVVSSENALPSRSRRCTSRRLGQVRVGRAALASGLTSTGYIVMKVGWISVSSTFWSKVS